MIAYTLAAINVCLAFYLSCKALFISTQRLFRLLKTKQKNSLRLSFFGIIGLVASIVIAWTIIYFIYPTIKLSFPSQINGYGWLYSLRILSGTIFFFAIPFLVEFGVRFFLKKRKK